MKKCFLLISLLLTIPQLQAQSKQEVMLNESIDLLGLGQRDAAIQMLDHCLSKYPNFDQALFVRATWYIDARDYMNALTKLQKLEEINPKFNPLQKKMIAECYFDQRNFNKASHYADEFFRMPNISPANTENIKKLIRNIEFVKSQPEDNGKIVYRNLGPEVNTNENEYFPSTSADESVIYFTRKTKGNEDIWLSHQNGSGGYMPAIMIDEPEMVNDLEYTSINTYENDGAHTISPNGKFLFFTSCERIKNVGKCDIYFAALKGNQWGKPKILTTAINTKHWETQPCVSADGKKLFFISNKPEGFGAGDIYMSEIDANGKFGEAKNLGDKINTAGREERPFIHPDGQTLYFASDSRPGYGGFDLYMSRLENGEWQEPVNLGGQINTTGDEISIFINALGNTAYVAKQNLEEPKNGFDLYSFALPNHIKPHQVTYIKGLVTNAKTSEPIKASVKLSDIEKSTQVMSISSDEKNGDFLMTVVADKEYGFNVIKEGYAIFSENYSFKATGSNEPQTVEIKLMPLEAGTKFELRNVFFATGKFELLGTSANELNYIYEILKANPNMKILIGGHTDNIGQAASNLSLSENRALSVMNYLVEKGIEASRLSHKGYGSTNPIAPNDTEEGRAKNRRTEIEVL